MEGLRTLEEMREMLKSREALITERAPRAGGLVAMTPPLHGGGRGFDSHPAHSNLIL